MLLPTLTNRSRHTVTLTFTAGTVDVRCACCDQPDADGSGPLSADTPLTIRPGDAFTLRLDMRDWQSAPLLSARRLWGYVRVWCGLVRVFYAG